jgi:hypothetical protein
MTQHNGRIINMAYDLPFPSKATLAVVPDILDSPHTVFGKLSNVPAYRDGFVQINVVWPLEYFHLYHTKNP